MRVRVVARLSADEVAFSRFLVGSLGFHVLLVVVLVLAPALRRGNRIPDAPLFVDLVAQMPAPPAPPAASVPAAPPAPAEPTPASEGVRVETQAPEPAPDAPPPAEKKPEKKPEVEPASRPSPSPPAPLPEAPAFPAPGAAGGSSITALEGVGDVELGWYKSTVTAALYGSWRKPILEAVADMREVRVTFEILRDGSVRGLRVENPSGVPSLDRSALRAVGDAAPFPPLPPNWREPTLSAGFVFRLYPE